MGQFSDKALGREHVRDVRDRAEPADARVGLDLGALDASSSGAGVCFNSAVADMIWPAWQ